MLYGGVQITSTFKIQPKQHNTSMDKRMNKKISKFKIEI